MITDHSTTLRKLLFRYRSDVVVVLLITVAGALLRDHVRFEEDSFYEASGLLLAALSIFVVFRVRESYNRWWEARIQWGSVVNSSRSFARQVVSLVQGVEGESPAALHRELVYRQVAWVNAQRLGLRREESWNELAPFLEEGELATLETQTNKATQLLQTQGRRLAEARRRGVLDPFGHVMLDRTLSDLSDTQGACERIKNTVFPDRISYIGRLVGWGLCLLIPFALFDEGEQYEFLAWIGTPILMLTVQVVVRLGADLRNPFENEPNDTPMSALCRTIEIDLREQLGEKDPPAPLKPVDGVLL